MKFYITACLLSYLFFTGSAQPRFNRPHPLYNRGQNPDLLTALLFGLDYNEILALQNLNNRGPQGSLGFGFDGLLPSFGFPPGPRGQARLRQDMNTLSLLGIIDGPDTPDGPATGQGRKGGRGQGPSPAGGGAAGAVAGREGVEGASGPRREGPRRGGAQ